MEAQTITSPTSSLNHVSHTSAYRYHDGPTPVHEKASAGMSASRALPSSTSSTISLRLATPAQRLQHSHISAVAWKGPLPTADAFVRREVLLHNTTLTRDGGITGWVLTDKEGRELMGCETIRKRGLLARAGQEKIEEAVVHSVGAVYCPEQHRGRGYARRLMDELIPRLERWQRKDGQPVISVLYSEIGRDFYARHGWHPYSSKHIRLPVDSEHPIHAHDRDLRWPENAQPVFAKDITRLAARDEALIRQQLGRKALAAGPGGKDAFALVPDVETFEWFHARQVFVYGELHEGADGPTVQGAVVRDESSGKALAWCLWTCMWFEKERGVRGKNTLYILRLVIDDEELSKAPKLDGEESKAEKVVSALLEAAKRYASRWGMGGVEMWNPDQRTLKAAEMVAGGEVEVVDRDMESITCLKVFGEDDETVEWIANEKFGWC